ncbi:molybdenum cofactor guanylyltransferase MobA [Mesorhizobium sp. RP14(2022)]|uniref:Molybdenum cofactor guanylyltransferase n=1 Tax=Mesorhizobium liriopis TaxID=2953882 RepID=A0ABT1CBF6_9HYPH|nr:molybdenum cofactor guanylyltransferase MobA [Mesorhizobium liriopis]MCO6052149.1 molybdenum cofactor guanylyltransferase MobA [Mesorhizobium liriopis]
MRIAGVVLAGGRSSRMGFDKAFATLRGEPLLARAVRRLQVQVEAVAVNSNADHDRFLALGLPILPDTVPDHPGPLAGILASLEWASSRADAVVTVAVDTPFFPDDLIAKLAEDGVDQAAVAATNRLHPTFALWPTYVRERLPCFLREDEKRRVTGFLDLIGFRTVTWPAVPNDPFFNINTPDDLRAAEAMA